uniref:Protein kinase domain-containing protein n=1 Tax=Brassica campestris TaxID=3711 RepID=M4CCL7_BRACM
MGNSLKSFKRQPHSVAYKRPIYVSEEEEPLPWEIRVKIAIGVARGVEFIHFIKNKPTIYVFCNVKTICVIYTGRLDLKSDVFTLGVILLDLVIGSKDTIRKERRKSIATTRPSLLCDAQKIREIINPRLRNDYPVNAVKEMGILIQRCTKWDKNERPLMQQVLDSLSYIAEFKTSV